MPQYSSAILFLFGLGIGSFLNVLSLRYEPGGRIFARPSIGGRSHCRSCQRTLAWYELIPLLSFIIQLGRCRGCGGKISWQYPLVELISALATVFIPKFLYQHYSAGSFAILGGSIAIFYLTVALWLVATYTFILMAVIDFRHYLLPDQGNILLGIIGILIIKLKYFFPNFFSGRVSFLGPYAGVFGFSSLLIGAGLAVLSAIIIFGGIILLSRGRGMGLGDLKLAIPIALILGWPDVILAFASSFVIGAVISVLLIAFRGRSLKSVVPFGPFLIIGVFVIMFYGEPLARWYFGLVR